MRLSTRNGRVRAMVAIAAALIGLAAAAAPAAADARKIYLNGVELSDVDVRNQSFAGCAVRFDGAGNLHITVKGFRIAKTAAPRTAAGTPRPAPRAHLLRAKPGRMLAPALVTRAANGRYFVIARTPTSGAANPYQVAIRLNGKLIRRTGPDSGTMAIDVTRFVKPGLNELALHAVRKHTADARRRSFSPVDRMEIVLGQGAISKGAVVIRYTHFEFARTAAETKTYQKVFKFYMR